MIHSLRLFCAGVAATLLLLLATPASGELPVVGISIVQDGETLGGDLGDPIVEEIRTLLEGEFEARFFRESGDWTTESIRAALERTLADDDIDLVVAVGAISSQLFCCYQSLPKPVIATVILDADLQNLPQKDGTSGVRNLNYLTFPDSFASDLERFLAIASFDELAIVVSQSVVENIQGGIEQRILAEGTPFGIRLSLVEAGESVLEAVAAIPESAEGVYVAPLLHFDNAERQLFFEQLIERQLPSFSLFGVLDVERGALAGQRDVTFYERLTRRVALNVQRILLGEEAGDLPVTIPDRQLLTINMETARQLRTYPPWEVLAEAELLHEDPDYGRKLSLADAVRETIAANLDLLAGRRKVAAGAQEVEAARALLRPQIVADVTAVQIDQDRVSAFSSQGETTLAGGLSLTQLLYSEPARANLAAQGYLQLSREEALEQLRLDLAQEAALAYLNVLRTKTFERIRRSDLRLTRSNLELAKVRQSLGTAGPGEVYRWESRLAGARLDLVNAQASRYQSQEALNRLLHRWQGEGFETEDVGLGDPTFITSQGRIDSYNTTPIHTEVFGEFAVKRGLLHSPELAQVDAAIAAQERLALSTRRAYSRPELALQATFEEILETGGTAPNAGGLPITPTDETSWSVALRGSIPLFEGGARRAERIQAEETLAQLRLEREALAERIELSIRSQLHQIRASFAGIRLSRQASMASKKTLDLVTDAYSRGAADILELLDAQSTSLTAEVSEADALYQFFIDLVEFERAINRLDFFTSPEEDEAWFEELDEFFRESGVTPRPNPSVNFLRDTQND